MIDHLTSIVAIDRQGAIGCKNQLPWSIKSDMQFFRRTTMHNTVIMGRKTYDSIGGCLKDRRNLVLSHRFDLFASTDGCRLVNSASEAIASAMSQGGSETFVVGGAATYLEFASYVDRYLVTFVDHLAEDADSFLSSKILAEFDGWQCEKVADFPATEGKDQFAFRIVQFDAPNACERREMRKSISERCLGKPVKKVAAHQNHRPSRDPKLQAAFSF